MDELDQALQQARAELRAVNAERAALRAQRGGDTLPALAQQLADVQAEALRLERKSAELDQALAGRRRAVQALRAKLAGGG